MEGFKRNSLICGISFTAGIAIGGFTAYAISKRYFEERSAAEKQELAAYYDAKYARIKKEEKLNEERIEEKSSDPEQEAEIQSEYAAISDIYRTQEKKEDPVAYANYFDNSSNNSSDTGKRKSKKKKRLDVEVVDPEVWDENPAGLDSKFLVFYDADNVLVDEESEQIFDDDFDKQDIIKAIETGEPDANGVLILQSNITKTLYHVTVEQTAYSEAILNE